MGKGAIFVVRLLFHRKMNRPSAVMVLGRFFIPTHQAFNLVIFVIGCRIQTHINTLINNEQDN